MQLVAAKREKRERSMMNRIEIDNRWFHCEWQALATLCPPLRVKLVDCWPEGSIWAVIQDSANQQSVVCFDGRETSRTRYRLFEGNKHPRRPNARIVELGSPEEDLVIGRLSRWYDSDGFWRGGYWPDFREMVQEALLRLRLCDPDDQRNDQSFSNIN